MLQILCQFGAVSLRTLWLWATRGPMGTRFNEEVRAARWARGLTKTHARPDGHAV